MQCGVVMSKYKIFKNVSNNFTDESVIIICDDGRQFPLNDENPDYMEYLRWLADGNEVEEWNPDASN